MRRELALFRNVVALLKKIPVDFGQYEVRHTTKGKVILLGLLEDGRGKKALDLGCREQYWTQKSTPNSSFWLFRIFRLFGKGPAEMQNEDHKQFFGYEDLRRLLPSAQQYGYFPYLFYKRTLRSGFSLLSPTIVVENKRPKRD